jgi:carboxypeptidase PM20D1
MSIFTKKMLIMVSTLSLTTGVFASDLTSDQRLARDIYKEAVETATSSEQAGSTIALANKFKVRLKAAGFIDEDITILEMGAFGGLIVRYRGSDITSKGIGFLGHMDVVTAYKKDWVLDPFTLTEKDGYFMGRGTADNKAGVVGILSTFIKLKKEGYVPNRDLYIVFTGDEETGMTTTMALAKMAAEAKVYGDLLNIEFAFNGDVGGGMITTDDKPIQYRIQAAEKTYHTLNLTVKNPGGHSSRPRKDNAIYQLMDALKKIQTYEFPVIVNEVTSGFLMAMADKETPENAQALRTIVKHPLDKAATAQLSKSVLFNATLRTTCVATMLDAGHAENALPQSATATVNCRIMPATTPQAVEQKLAEVIGDKDVLITALAESTNANASPLTPVVMDAVKYAVSAHYGDVSIVPSMSTGGTDGKEFRALGIPVYGVSGMFSVTGESNAHGLNEKVQVKSFYRSLDHWERLIKHATGGVK